LEESGLKIFRTQEFLANDRKPGKFSGMGGDYDGVSDHLPVAARVVLKKEG